MSIESALDGARPGRDDPEADREWRSLRARVHALCASEPRFDPRHALTLHGEALADWRAQRLAWVVEALKA